MPSFFGELRRRNVIRVGIAYLAAIWVLVQVADTVLPVFDAPDWLLRALVFSSALGFPLALVLAWFYELTPQGIKATADVEAVEAVKFTGRKIDFAIIGLLVLAVGFLLVRAPVDRLDSVLPNSVAVLPFENLSPDPNDDYFAAGIHEEILNQLTKIRDLNIIARTSVLQYAGASRPAAEIARELRVQAVMEGSVRFGGGRVRISTQLVDAATSTRIWSETYDREFAIENILAIESDIAMNVATVLEAELLPTERRSIARIPTESPEAYAFYLSALVSVDELNFATSTIDQSSLGLLDRAILLDPEFADAHALKAFLLSANFVYDVAAETEDAVARAAELEGIVVRSAEKALSLEPTLGLAYAALGTLHMREWRKSDAEEAFEAAYKLSPSDPAVLSQYAAFKAYTDQPEAAISAASRAVALDPNGVPPIRSLIEANLIAGRFNSAADAARRYIELRPAEEYAYFTLAEVEGILGDPDEALRSLEIAEQIGSGRGPGHLARAAEIYSRLGRTDDAMRLFSELESLSPSPSQAAIANLAVGNVDESLRLFREASQNELPLPGRLIIVLAKINAWNDPILDQPEFLQVRNALGFQE